MIRRAETGAFQTVCAQYMNLVPGMCLACIMRTLAGVKTNCITKDGADLTDLWADFSRKLKNLITKS